VTATGTFNSGKNGQVNASLTATPTPPTGFSCPDGQEKPQLAEISYTNILLTDTTNNERISVPNVESGCLLPRVRGACDKGNWQLRPEPVARLQVKERLSERRRPVVIASSPRASSH
jgi:hypothetical protein